MTNPDAAWRRIKQQAEAHQPTSQEQAEDRMRREREAERKALAEVQGVTIPIMPPRLDGETDREYGVRIAWIAKSHCGPAPRPKVPPKRLPKEVSQMAQFTKPPAPGEDTVVAHGERLANMTPDPTTEDEP